MNEGVRGDEKAEANRENGEGTPPGRSSLIWLARVVWGWRRPRGGLSVQARAEVDVWTGRSRAPKHREGKSLEPERDAGGRRASIPPHNDSDTGANLLNRPRHVTQGTGTPPTGKTGGGVDQVYCYRQGHPIGAPRRSEL